MDEWSQRLKDVCQETVKLKLVDLNRYLSKPQGFLEYFEEELATLIAQLGAVNLMQLSEHHRIDQQLLASRTNYLYFAFLVLRLGPSASEFKFPNNLPQREQLIAARAWNSYTRQWSVIYSVPQRQKGPNHGDTVI
ncbi:hypothetical protein WA026_006555 [Henosepilachna vigintioctopunctata]|uniref:Uncharacterized protein n=1 Tax=Henosepilachna vigintioctopunctata TaxID=420089 RepID=A0AAW1UFB7_9CUCU